MSRHSDRDFGIYYDYFEYSKAVGGRMPRMESP